MLQVYTSYFVLTPSFSRASTNNNLSPIFFPSWPKMKTWRTESRENNLYNKLCKFGDFQLIIIRISIATFRLLRSVSNQSNKHLILMIQNEFTQMDFKVLDRLLNILSQRVQKAAITHPYYTRLAAQLEKNKPIDEKFACQTCGLQYKKVQQRSAHMNKHKLRPLRSRLIKKSPKKNALSRIAATQIQDFQLEESIQEHIQKEKFVDKVLGSL